MITIILNVMITNQSIVVIRRYLVTIHITIVNKYSKLYYYNII